MDTQSESIPMGLNLCSSCGRSSSSPSTSSDDLSASINSQKRNHERTSNKDIDNSNRILSLRRLSVENTTSNIHSNERMDNRRRHSENLQIPKLRRLSKTGIETGQVRKSLTTIREESVTRDSNRTRDGDSDLAPYTSSDRRNKSHSPTATQNSALKSNEASPAASHNLASEDTIDVLYLNKPIIGHVPSNRVNENSYSRARFRWQRIFRFMNIIKKSASVQPEPKFQSSINIVNLNITSDKNIEPSRADSSAKIQSGTPVSSRQMKTEKNSLVEKSPEKRKKTKTSPFKPILGLSPIKTKIIPLIRILVIGLDNSGKTSVIKNLQGDMGDKFMSPTVSTIGFSNVKMKRFRQKYDVELYDVGGSSSIRSIWSNYLGLVHGIIFVIDSTEVHRFEEARQCLQSVLSDYRAQNKPLLVYMNKQDLETSEDEFEIKHRLGLDGIINKYRCPTKIEAGSAILNKQGLNWTDNTITNGTNNGQSLSPTAPSMRSVMGGGNNNLTQWMDTSIESGYNWLVSYIVRNYIKLQERVNYDSLRQTEKENKTIQDRFLRFHSNHHAGATNTARRSKRHGSASSTTSSSSLKNKKKTTNPLSGHLITASGSLKTKQTKQRSKARRSTLSIVQLNNSADATLQVGNRQHPLSSLREQASHIDILALQTATSSSPLLIPPLLQKHQQQKQQ